jgi:hypothetical protein
MTAVRETFEESGLLLASSHQDGELPTCLSETELDSARHAIHANQTLFREFLGKHGLSPDVQSLLPFTQWITPPMAPR